MKPIKVESHLLTCYLLRIREYHCTLMLFAVVTVPSLTGPPVTFAMDVAPLRILPPAGFIRVPSGSFSAVLVLDEPADNTVDITCSLDTVPPGAQLDNTSELCLGSPRDQVAFTNTTVEIKLDKKDIQFQVC